MNESQTRKATEGLNGLAVKVLDAVPLQEAWTITQIVGELKRRGANPDMQAVDGCLHTLRGRGLIREAQRGRYQAVPLRMSPDAEEDDPPPVPPPAPAEAALQRWEDLAAMARELSRQAGALASLIETAALEAEERVQAAGRKGEELEQFRALLRKLV